MPPPDDHLIEHLDARQDILHGNFLHARRDTVRLPSGRHATREYVVHPGAVMIVPLLDTPAGAPWQVIMERQFRYPVGQVITEFPAGKRDPGEDLWLCAQRELREETGYRAAEWAHAGVLHPLVAYSTEIIDVWFARGLRAGERALDEGEFLDVISVGLDDVLLWCRDGRITDGKTLAAALWLQNLASGAWSLEWQPAAAGPAAG
ncbi:MAG: NUDIX hydrolase [Rhodoferax sp.]|jgi:ADP-ribose pyrophosphatase|nr:NUDIX hydrolase [Rhodoferax sp.]